jgi:predicted dehydrogenase
MDGHRVLIIGCGGIARHHVAAFQAAGCGRAAIGGLADADGERARQFAAANGLDAAIWTDYRAALAGGGFDIVCICTPPPLHRIMAVDSLDAGAHVLLEKPMAVSLADCDAMIEAARRNRRVLAVAAQNRYRSEYWRVRELIRSGVCGNILSMRAESAWWRGAEYYQTWHGSWKGEGGGCVLNLAIHQIDLLLWIAGRPAEITAFMSNVKHGADYGNIEVEDLAAALLRFIPEERPSGAAGAADAAGVPVPGALGEILASAIHHGEGQRLFFQTERADVSLPFAVRCTKARAAGLPEEDPGTAAAIEAEYAAIPPLERELFTGQAADFLACIDTGAASPRLSDGRSGRGAVEVVTAIYKAAATGKPVRLPVGPDDPFYADLWQKMPRYTMLEAVQGERQG